MLAAPAHGSSSSLECRDTLEEVVVLKAEVDKFNDSVEDLRKARRALFEESNVFGDSERLASSWSHVFSVSPRETVSKPNEIVKQWYYNFTKLTANDTPIKKDNDYCVWVGSESWTDIFEVTTNTLTNTISKKVITD